MQKVKLELSELENSYFVNHNAERLNKFLEIDNGKEIILSTIKDYLEYDIKNNSSMSIKVAETLGWIAEDTKSKDNVDKAISMFHSKDIFEIINKYNNGISEELMEQIRRVVIDAIYRKHEVEFENFIAWLKSPMMNKLLSIANEFSGYENAKLKKNILGILLLDSSVIDSFSKYSNIISNKKCLLDRRVKILNILKDIVNLRKERYAEVLVKEGIDKLKKIVEKDIGFDISDSLYSIRTAIMLTEFSKKDKNIEFLVQNKIKFGSIEKWIFSDQVTKKVIDEMKKIGIDPEIYVASGMKILESKSDERFSTDWSVALRNLVTRTVGIHGEVLPKVYIRDYSPNFIFEKIKNDYILSLKKDKNAAKSLLEKLRGIILDAYPDSNFPKPVRRLFDDIERLERAIEYGGVFDFRGAKVTAKIWERSIPEDFFDSEMLRCCIFLPYGEQRQEIPVFMMDPKTTIIHYYIHGLEEPVGAATIYLGVSEGKPTIFLDTWEAGGLIYSGLGSDKMKEFVLKSLVEFSDMIGAERVLVFSGGDYGRPEEFCNFLKKRYKTRVVDFECIDSDDSVLATYSHGPKHHYTDAMNGEGSIKGKFEVFVIKD